MTDDPEREAEIVSAFVGPSAPHDATIHLAEYDPEWPRWFAREEQRIREALGDTVVLLEHVGSTSIPGMAAKPRIDIRSTGPNNRTGVLNGGLDW